LQQLWCPQLQGSKTGHAGQGIAVEQHGAITGHAGQGFEHGQAAKVVCEPIASATIANRDTSIFFMIKSPFLIFCP